MVRPAPDLLARPAVCGHPTGMILTRARTLLRPCSARLLATLVGEPDGFAAGAFHARPLRWQSKSRRARKHALGRQSALRPLRFAPTIGAEARGLAFVGISFFRLLTPRTSSTPNERSSFVISRSSINSPRLYLVNAMDLPLLHNFPMPKAFPTYTLYSFIFLQNIHVTNKRPSCYTQLFRQLIHSHGWLLFNNTDNP